MSKYQCDWDQELLEFSESKLSYKEFCKTKEYAVHTLKYHAYKPKQNTKQDAKLCLLPISESEARLLVFHIQGVEVAIPSTLSSKECDTILHSLLRFYG